MGLSTLHMLRTEFYTMLEKIFLLQRESFWLDINSNDIFYLCARAIVHVILYTCRGQIEAETLKVR